MGSLLSLAVSFILLFYSAEVLAVNTGTSESIGFYSAGCMENAEILPINGDGYQVMRLSRKRNYGHRELIEFIKQFSSQVKNDLHGQLLVGDMSQNNGGPMPDGHASHQIGLDVDIWLWHPQDKRIFSEQERESVQAKSLVKDEDAKIIDKKLWNLYSEDYFSELLKKASENVQVERIFVNAVIKQKLCELHKGESWLHKIRPWWGHDEHLHVRLRCFGHDEECEIQDPIPNVGDGCNEDLAYWFTPEAKNDRAESLKQPKNPPVLPVRCNLLLNNTKTRLD